MPRNTDITDYYEPLDQYDSKILTALSADGRLSTAVLAQRIGLSKTACYTRVRRLESNGCILGYRAIIDPIKLGLEHVAFTEIKLSDTTAAALASFDKAVLLLPEIEECHMIAGSFDYLLKVRTKNIRDYRRFFGEELSRLPYIAHTSTFIAMDIVKDYAMAT
ncbi:MAG: Lrp/AsnC family leucine-responsive transcriptional regulator [Halioglobus sp.]|jgi:Lrp/AsnC family leucine-responsive transcriptional regulator